MQTRLYFFFAAFLIHAVPSESQNLVNLSVYYESLCPDSINFIKFQLYPTWVLLSRDHITVDFVPYGKASQHKTENGTWKFNCQHGPNECQGNKEQACALSIYQNSTTQVKFISCVMSTKHPNRAGSQCAGTLNLNYNKIKNCTEGTEGAELLAAMGNRTHSFTPPITFVPTVAFNGVYSQHDQDAAMTNLLNVICQHFKDPKPGPCST